MKMVDGQLIMMAKDRRKMRGVAQVLHVLNVEELEKFIESVATVTDMYGDNIGHTIIMHIADVFVEVNTATGTATVTDDNMQPIGWLNISIRVKDKLNAAAIEWQESMAQKVIA